MRENTEGVRDAVELYIQKGWKVDYTPDNLNSTHQIYSPNGSAFQSYDLERYICPYCDEDNPDWEEEWCNHSQELIEMENNARNLLFLVLKYPRLSERNLS